MTPNQSPNSNGQTLPGKTVLVHSAPTPTKLPHPGAIFPHPNRPNQFTVLCCRSAYEGRITPTGLPTTATSKDKMHWCHPPSTSLTSMEISNPITSQYLQTVSPISNRTATQPPEPAPANISGAPSSEVLLGSDTWTTGALTSKRLDTFATLVLPPSVNKQLAQPFGKDSLHFTLVFCTKMLSPHIVTIV